MFVYDPFVPSVLVPKHSYAGIRPLQRIPLAQGTFWSRIRMGQRKKEVGRDMETTALASPMLLQCP